MEYAKQDPVAPPRRKKAVKKPDLPTTGNASNLVADNLQSSPKSLQRFYNASKNDVQSQPATYTPVKSEGSPNMKPPKPKVMLSPIWLSEEPASEKNADKVTTSSRPPLSPKVARRSAKVSENDKENASSKNDRVDAAAVSDSAVHGRTGSDKSGSESPKKKPVRPELPKSYSTSRDHPPRPAPFSPARRSPSLTAPQVQKNGPANVQNAAESKTSSECDFRIIDSRVKSLERRFSKTELQGRDASITPTRRDASIVPTRRTLNTQPAPPRKHSKEHVLKANPETSLGSSVRSAAQSFFNKVKASTLPRSLLSNNHSKSSNAPERPPQPAPLPLSDGPIYETIKNSGEFSASSSYSPIYSYIEPSHPLGQSHDMNRVDVCKSAPPQGYDVDGRVYTPLDLKTVNSPEYEPCSPFKIEDSCAKEEDNIYVDMSGISQSSGSSSSGNLKSSSPIVTTKHLLPTEDNDDDDDDYMFMSPHTLQSPSIYMKPGATPNSA